MLPTPPNYGKGKHIGEGCDAAVVWRCFCSGLAEIDRRPTQAGTRTGDTPPPARFLGAATMIGNPPPGWEPHLAPAVPAAPLGRATSAAVTTGLSGLRRTYSLVRAAYLGFMALILGFGALSAGAVGHNVIVM